MTRYICSATYDEQSSTSGNGTRIAGESDLVKKQSIGTPRVS